MKELFKKAYAGFTNFVRNVFDKVRDAFDVVVDVISGRPNDPSKVSPEFAQALKEPVVNGELNPKLQLDKFKVNFKHNHDSPSAPKLGVSFETPRLTGRSIGTGTEKEQEEDYKFIAQKLYGDPRVTRTYATGKRYNTAEAAENATKRIKMFSDRANNRDIPHAFRGFIVQSKATGERVGVVNIGVNGFELSAEYAEPAMMIARKSQGKGFGTELYALGMFYLREIFEAKDYFRTPAGGKLDSVLFTARPNNRIASRFDLKPIDPTSIGAKPENTVDKYGKGSRDLYQVNEATVRKLTGNTRLTA